MSNSIRGLVSKEKKRFKKDGFNLDLTYITPRIIAMGFPSEGTEGIYRNNMADVQRFFATYHAGNFKVYNLCSERSYDPMEFGGSAAHFPFDDHNPCPLEMIPALCENVKEYLDEDPNNVVAIHCKAGKGRTGLIVSCLLQHLEERKTAEEALKFFGDERTKNGKGVTIPSQMRYVRYYQEYLAYLKKKPLVPPSPRGGAVPPSPRGGGGTPETKGPPSLDSSSKSPVLTPLTPIQTFACNHPVRISKFVMGPRPDCDPQGGCDPYFKMLNMEGQLLYNSNKHYKTTHWHTTDEKENESREFACGTAVEGDVHVIFYDWDAGSKDDKMFGFWFHTALLHGTSLKLGKKELDGAIKDKHHKMFNKDFTIEMFFEKITQEEYECLTISERQDGFKKTSKGTTNKIRSLVSQKKIRYQKDGYDLDLTYIIENKLIAMGFPAHGTEGMYRNNMNDVRRFFEQYHSNHFKVYNLCRERVYDSKELESVGGKCGYFPFDDHNPPPFSVIPKLIEDATGFMKGDKKNVIAIHCKAGKGRTGLIISCLLLNWKLATTATDALQIFGRARTADGEGVTIPSQQRYVGFYEKYLLSETKGEVIDLKTPIYISKIKLDGPAPNFDHGGGCDPYFKIFRIRDGLVLWDSSKIDKITHWYQEPSIEFIVDVPAQGDIKIVFYDRDKMSDDDKMFQFWFHCALLDGTSLTLQSDQLDGAHKDKHQRYDSKFAVTLTFSKMTLPDYNRTAKPLQTRGSISQPVKRQNKHKGLANNLRGLVSKKKLRFQQEGFDLDLSYITDRIIAMGYPADGAEQIFRNSMPEVKRFFTKYHPNHFKIINLCAERKYDPKEFESIGGQCSYYPFLDHNPCQFELIPPLCRDVADWLRKDPKNVVAIHCKAGKGRSGMMIACCLLYMGECATPGEALEYFGNQRTKNKKGVTIPSQMRWVNYFAQWLRAYYPTGRPFNFQGPAITLTGILLSEGPANFDVGGGCDPYFKLSDLSNEVFYNMKKAQKKIKEWRTGSEFKIDCKINVQGEVKVNFYDKDQLGKDDKMFSFWFHTSFITSPQLRLGKMDLDKACKDKHNEHFDPRFFITVFFEGLPEEKDIDEDLAMAFETNVDEGENDTDTDEEEPLVIHRAIDTDDEDDTDDEGDPAEKSQRSPSTSSRDLKSSSAKQAASKPILPSNPRPPSAKTPISKNTKIAFPPPSPSIGSVSPPISPRNKKLTTTSPPISPRNKQTATSPPISPRNKQGGGGPPISPRGGKPRIDAHEYDNDDDDDDDETPPPPAATESMIAGMAIDDQDSGDEADDLPPPPPGDDSIPGPPGSGPTTPTRSPAGSKQSKSRTNSGTASTPSVKKSPKLTAALSMTEISEDDDVVPPPPMRKAQSSIVLTPGKKSVSRDDSKSPSGGKRSIGAHSEELDSSGYKKLQRDGNKEHFEGLLKKRANKVGLGVWQQRYYILSPSKGLLTWYKKKPLTFDDKPQGKLRLDSLAAVEVVEGSNPHCFDISLKNGHVYHLQQLVNDPVSTAERWVNKIKPNITPDVDLPVILTGYLKKKSPKSKEHHLMQLWQTRYFTLDTHKMTIVYRAKSSDTSALKPLGSIDLKNVKACDLKSDKHRAYRFDIRLKNNPRVFMLQAESAYLANLWVRQITAIIPTSSSDTRSAHSSDDLGTPSPMGDDPMDSSDHFSSSSSAKTPIKHESKSSEHPIKKGTISQSHTPIGGGKRGKGGDDSEDDGPPPGMMSGDDDDDDDDDD